MKAKVYIETSVLSYLSGRLSRDIVVVGRQEITREMWPLLTAQYDCYVSPLVREEIERGDPEAAGGRLANLADIAVLTITEDTRHLARALIENRLVPSRFPEDALHIAIAAVHGMDYLLTWNFKPAGVLARRIIRRIVMKDPIVEEVRRARDAHARQFNYDLDAIVDDLKKREKESGVPTVSLPPKRPTKKKAS